MSTYVSRLVKNAVFNPVDIRKNLLSTNPARDLIGDKKSEVSCKNSVKLTIRQPPTESEMDNQMEVSEVSECPMVRDLPESLQYLGLVSKDEQKKAQTGKWSSADNLEEMKDDFRFAKPLIYDCGYCNASFFHLKIYMKHVRQHKDIIRCKSCNKRYDNLLSKRTHEARCRKIY